MQTILFISARRLNDTTLNEWKMLFSERDSAHIMSQKIWKIPNVNIYFSKMIKKKVVIENTKTIALN